MREQLIMLLYWLIIISGTGIILVSLIIWISYKFQLCKIAWREEKEFMEKYNAWEPENEETQDGK